MNLDRTLQLQVLRRLKDAYPEMVDVSADEPFSENPDTQGNLFYLEAHGLISAHGKRENIFNAPSMIFTAKITAKGLDFLEDDGGLGAVLGRVTIRIDDDQLRGIITARIATADIPEEEKNAVVAVIRNLPSEALKAACMRLVNLGLDNLPAAVHLLQTYAGQLL